MRLHLLSDIHLEFASFTPPATEADVTILAGDIDLGLKGIAWARKQWPDRPVLYIAGNHEYYRQTLPLLDHQLFAAAHGTNVHFLQNKELILGGVRFLGCTLWTDFAVFGPGDAQRQAMEACAFLMADYRVIRIKADGTRLRPEDTVQLHQASLQFLEQALARPFAGPTVIVTHHAPSLLSTAERFRHDPTTAAFASHLGDFAAHSGAALWLHGHTHSCSDYTLGPTRVLANQRGYPGEEVGNFDPGLVVEV